MNRENFEIVAMASEKSGPENPVSEREARAPEWREMITGIWAGIGGLEKFCDREFILEETPLSIADGVLAVLEPEQNIIRILAGDTDQEISPSKAWLEAKANFTEEETGLLRKVLETVKKGLNTLAEELKKSLDDDNYSEKVSRGIISSGMIGRDLKTPLPTIPVGLILKALSLTKGSEWLSDIDFEKTEIKSEVIDEVLTELAGQLVGSVDEFGGWCWRCDSPPDGNKSEKVDLASTYFACLGLREWQRASKVETQKGELLENAKNAVDNAVKRVLIEVSQTPGQRPWREFCDKGRRRYLDLILGLSILIEFADEPLLAEESIVFLNAIDHLLYSEELDFDAASTYHLFRSGDLLAQVLVEELGVIYLEFILLARLWRLPKRLLRDGLEKLKQQNNADLDKKSPDKAYIRLRLQRTQKSLSQIIEAPLFRLRLRRIWDEIKRRRVEEGEWEGMWEEGAHRIYTTGLAALGIALSIDIPILFGDGEEDDENREDNEADFQQALANILRSPYFSNEFAVQVMRSLDTQAPRLLRLLRKG
uniref:Uncharacterized protein n=1 Tax=Candidatus Kentrum sp. TC TaxID=2126339 RepID=A0A450YQD5_9GAMM|nr:MAG: hypothetical protein BECKTC1821D_GA0114238_101823 [Candidatus Kentron sp. TC]